MQGGVVARKVSVRRLSVKREDYDKTEEKSVQIFIPYERSFSLVQGSQEQEVKFQNQFFLLISGQFCRFHEARESRHRKWKFFCAHKS